VTILGIETSCDETSAAVLEGKKALSNVISSQLVHSKFGGVVPELASRAHVRMIIPVINEALERAGKTLDDIDGFAVTHGPGLVGALLVGLNFIKGLSLSSHKPFVGVNHMEGHIYGNLLSQQEFKFPILFLIVSGGHTQIVLMKQHLHYEILGTTRDDAVGEAFDKTAKILGLGYPGGPVIDKMAKEGDPEFVKFPRAFLNEEHYDFSYSGLKTAVLTYLQKHDAPFVKKNLANICASFQWAAVDVLIQKSMRAARQYGVQAVAVAGGVAANSLLRQKLSEACSENGVEYYQPEFQYCTDNAAMIARAGAEYLERGLYATQELNAYPSLALKSLD